MKNTDKEDFVKDLLRNALIQYSETEAGTKAGRIFRRIAKHIPLSFIMYLIKNKIDLK